ncbi:MAG: alpha/beta fold hydrolase [Bermanella sp.]
MTLAIHHLSAKGSEDLPIIFCIHGWSCNAQVFQPLADVFKGRLQFIAVDLPGFGDSPCADAGQAYEITQLINELLAVAPENATWLGWSLGGMLAVQAAARAPQRVKNVMTLCSNAKFVADKTWRHGVPSPLYNGFLESVDNARVTLRRFAALTLVGEQQDLLSHLKWLQKNTQKPAPSSEVLSASLKLLALMDNRQILAHLPQPCLHMLATDDAIVPHGVSQQYNQINEKHLVSFVPNGSHASLITQPQAVANGILTFLQVNG